MTKHCIFVCEMWCTCRTEQKTYSKYNTVAMMTEQCTVMAGQFELAVRNGPRIYSETEYFSGGWGDTAVYLWFIFRTGIR